MNSIDYKGKAYFWTKWIISLISVTVFSQQSICADTTHLYSVDASENNGIGTLGSDYVWWVEESDFAGVIIPINASSNQIQIDWSNSPVGTYHLFVKEVNKLGCIAIQELEIRVLETITFEMDNLYLCPSDTEINAYGPSYLDTYSWTNDLGLAVGNSDTLTIQEEGTYYLTATSGECSHTEEFEVIRVAFPTLSFQMNDEGNVILLPSENSSSFFYQILDTEFSVIRAWQSALIFENLPMGSYLLQMKSKDADCINTQAMQLFYVSNIFTPNGDGVNDFWELYSLRNSSFSQLKIYDRYGKNIKTIYPSDDLKWDGKYHGMPLPKTTYWYILEFENQTSLKGFVTIR